jgi:hypothetical protein
MMLRRKRVSEYKNRETIINKLYDDALDYEKKNNHIKHHINRQDPKNIDKMDMQKRENIHKNLDHNHIRSVFAKEKKIHVILDNYTSHHTDLLANTAEILNMSLIFLP